MKRIEAKTLEEAYERAARELNCSVGDLEYEIIQHPSNGFLGIGAKTAIIVADCTLPERSDDEPEASPSSPSHNTTAPATPSQQSDTPPETEESSAEISQTPTQAPTSRTTRTATKADHAEEVILDSFFGQSSASGESDKESDEVPNEESGEELDEEIYKDAEQSLMLEAQVRALIESTCFDIDTVEVDVIDGTAFIFLDGEDAALLIGKEGYRYNALSYLLYNWIHNEFGLYVKLEIAQFLTSQQEKIRHHLQPVIEHVRERGWGKTRLLDGILVHIALEQLRETFPDKYVAIKRTRDGKRYVLVNAFNKRS
jgi:spoIIIJ-associated protein